MNEIKRQLSNDESVCEGTKILRSKFYEKRKSITCIEDLPNELFYEIFEYFDGFQLYAIFSNLNVRFKELLESSSIQLKIRVPFQTPSNFQNLYDNVIAPNKHRIISFSTLGTWKPNVVFSSLTIDSSFNRLENLVLWGIQSQIILPVLRSLSILTRLFSLRIYLNFNLTDDHDLYVAIFSLPLLIYTQISIETNELTTHLWTNSNYQLSPLQYLIMDYSCTIHKLITLLSYTPQLRHLRCRLLSRSNEIIDKDVNIILPNLTHLSIDRCDAQFEHFEIFMKKIGFSLEVLRFTTSNDVAYLNGDQWEQLFLQFMPHLRIFEFRYDEIISALEFITDDARIYEFTSAFWIERRWISEFIVEIDDWEDNVIIFSIHPHRKRWYSINELDENSSNSLHLSPSVILSRAGFHVEWSQFSIRNISLVFNMMQITHLIIDCPNIDLKSLIKLLNSLYNLYSLKLYSVLLSEEDDSYLFPTIDNLIKVNLRRINELRDVEFLLTLCPNMDYFEVDCSEEIDMKLLVRCILTKTNQNISQLRTVCLNEQKPSDGMIKELEDLIHHEELLQNYTIRCIDKKIYIQCE